jgi:glycosyltransferase involved in cell wall biosynthesis
MTRAPIIIALLLLAVTVGALEFRSANTQSGAEDAINSVAPLAPALSLPVAAYLVTGPLDVLTGCPAGEMNENLAEAVKQALKADPQAARDHALKFSWEACAKIFLSNLTPL